MKKLLLIALLFLCGQSFAQRIVKEGPITVRNHSKLHRGGTGTAATYWNNEKTPFTGTYIEIGFDNITIAESNYLNGQKHGTCKEFYSSNGAIHIEAEYKNGVIVKKTEYSREGEIIAHN